LPRQPQAPRELPPHYYRDNFHCLLDTVEDQYGDLLSPAESAFLEAYRSVSFAAQCLYVRLVSRVGPWFRESRLHYPELGRPGPVLDEMLQAGLAVQARELSVVELGGLCTVAELADIFALPVTAKASLLQQLEQLEPDSRVLLSTLESADAARVLAPAQGDVVALLQLLFFGNRRQGLTDFVLSDLGVAQYYPYKLDRSQRLFPDRIALDAFLDCATWEDRWQRLREQDDTDGMRELALSLSTMPARHPDVQRHWDRLYNRVARQLERMAENSLALALYEASGRHPARERSVRLMEKSGEYAKAESLCQLIIADPWCEDERDAAGRILPRLRRKLRGERTPRRPDKFAEVCLALPCNDQRVERQVARCLQADWERVHYVENSLMNALFGLAFWEQIFAPVPGAFHNPYQSVPADMYQQHFRTARADLIAQRLAELSATSLREELPRRFRLYSGLQCRWVNWRAISEELVSAAAAVIPREHLLAIWQRILFDPRENRRGFPDLIALGSLPGQYQMIEVKSPGDTLQDSQKRWLRFFSEHDIPATVARVTWSDG